MTTNNADIIDLRPGDSCYPVTITGFIRPLPIISAIGNLDLLKKPFTAGFCGSRHASKQGIEVAHLCVKQLSETIKDITIVSGNAAGIDLEVHYTALKYGANTIFVLPEGINNFCIKPKLRDVWDWGKVLVISQFPKNAVWRGWQAMQRNNLILAISKAMLVVEAKETGGTRAAAESAIKHEVPLFVVNYNDNYIASGNSLLLDSKNVMQLCKRKATGEANIDLLVKKIQEDSTHPPRKLLI